MTIVWVTLRLDGLDDPVLDDLTPGLDDLTPGLDDLTPGLG